MNPFRVFTALSCMGTVSLLTVFQPLTRRLEAPTLVEHNIPMFPAQAGGIKAGADGALWFAETDTNLCAPVPD